RRGVEVEVVFLYVLAVVRLTVRQPEQPLLQNWVFAVPQGERETQQLPIVRDPRQPVLAPSVGPRAGLLMTEVVPRVAGLAVVLSHRSPLPLAQVGPPLLPRCRAGSSLLQSLLLSTHSLAQRFSMRRHCVSPVWRVVVWHGGSCEGCRNSREAIRQRASV